MNVLMLTPHMRFGYGVAEAIRHLDAELAQLGIRSLVGCLTLDSSFPEVDARLVDADPARVRDLAEWHSAQVVVAHGSPFFELLPELGLPTIAYEYGDPIPELFVSDAPQRLAIVENKAANVYPHVSAVATISQFVRHDIGVPQATVIRLGADHVPDLGTKQGKPPGTEALRIGTLMRLGSGESRYKGTSLLPELRAHLDKSGTRYEFHVAGRGTSEEAAALAADGFRVHVNLSDDERSAYLRDLDVFVTLSLWEGMNLPLVEACALGTPGLALDTGAHPEFSPLIYSGVEAMAAQLAAYCQRRDLLSEHGRMCYAFVRRSFPWSETGAGFASLLLKVAGPPLPRRPVRMRYRLARSTVRRTVRQWSAAERARVAMRRFGRTNARQ